MLPSSKEKEVSEGRSSSRLLLLANCLLKEKLCQVLGEVIRLVPGRSKLGLWGDVQVQIEGPQGLRFITEGCGSSWGSLQMPW